MTDTADTADTAAANKALVERFWDDLFRRDFDAVGAYFAPDGHYVDVPLDEPGAYGPAEVAARLRLGLEPLSDYRHHPKLMVAEGDVVVTEHAEEWHWPTGEEALVPFTSVHEIRDGKIVRWWDYVNLDRLLAAAPEWWVERIMHGYK